MTYQRCQRTIYNLSTCRNWRLINRHKPVYPPTHGVPSQCNSKNLLLKDWLCNNRWIMNSITVFFSNTSDLIGIIMFFSSFYLVRCRTRIPIPFVLIAFIPFYALPSFSLLPKFSFFLTSFIWFIYFIFIVLPSSIPFLLILSVFILLVCPYRFRRFLFIFLIIGYCSLFSQLYSSYISHFNFVSQYLLYYSFVKLHFSLPFLCLCVPVLSII